MVLSTIMDCPARAVACLFPKVSVFTLTSCASPAAIVFAGVTVEWGDKRKEYGERRIICCGLLAGRLVVVGYTPRVPVRHGFNMRKANDREKSRLPPYLGI